MSGPSTPLLVVSDLRVCFGDDVHAVRGVSFTLDAGQTLAIVGESGSGKSTLGLSLLGLIQPPVSGGSIVVDGRELLGASAEDLRSVRWSTVSLALQGSPFNPVVRLGQQVAEPLVDRGRMSRAAARARADELAEEVALDPRLLDRYPHEVSGGERRRASVAMALALDPRLVILDEPTAGLDPTTRNALLAGVESLAAARGFALIVISHDLPGAGQLAERTMVFYAGEIVEDGSSSDVLADPVHPYSWALLNAVPVMSTTKDLRPIRGLAPDPRAVPVGCSFHPRCPQADQRCRDAEPALAPSRGRAVACHFGGLQELLRADGLTKTFGRGRNAVRAVDDVSFMVRAGESVGLIGPSGSGKSTLARMLAGHLVPDCGQVLVGGVALDASWRGGAAKQTRRSVQLVMQDPTDALSPRLTVAELVREPLDISGDGTPRRDRSEIVARALDQVGLPSTGLFLAARTHQLSGGQLQRVALARALIVGPRVVVADEPTAMLDASEQARLLVVLRERQVEMGLGLVLVSHDMAVIRKVVDRIVVLDRGVMVEEGRADEVSISPASAVGRDLVRAAPTFAFLGRRTAHPTIHGDEQ